ncbi:hypothetical protein NEMIN01_0885 [Nematocida minor]|uniref:uncharacterized protein n=1 Tax=Nematocida minor TaxID=1912983 RepID=UPI00222034E6|nr:uncharacterized protein NEMIN01_0885 [Nematocida minor]KAI5190100.1 hypothetical protein NEMIN01_0885 [Nematocida minor]
MGKEEISGSAAAVESMPPVKEPAATEKDDVKKQDKTDEKNKAEVPEAGANAEAINHEEASGRKKIKLGNNSYYVVSLEEIDRYIELKDTYKSDAMSAFIVYMHKDFIADLKSIRRRHSVKKGLFLILGIFTLIIIALAAVAILR